MKKNLFYYLFAVICSVTLFASCSDDDDKVVSPVGETTFTDANGLQLTYSGATMLGKKVTFSPNAADATKATLTLAGELDLSSLINRSTGASPQALGVIPGEITTVLNVENIVIDGDKVTFEGLDENNGRTVKYNGEVSSQVMKLALDVTMPANKLVGTSWNLKPTGTWFEGSPLSPIHINWKADEFEIPGGTWDINGALIMALTSTQIEGKTIPEMLSGILNKITFLPDGNIRAEYKDQLTDTGWKTSDLNIAMYKVSGDKLYLYLNISQIAASVNGKERTARGFEEILEGLIPSLLPMLSNGIPLSYMSDEEGNITAYLGMDVLLPILKAVAPMFENAEFINSLIEMLKEQAGDMAYMVEILRPVLVAMPQVIATTTDIQMGLELVPAK